MEESGFERYGTDRILILDRDGHDPQKFWDLLAAQIPDTKVTVTSSAREFLELIDAECFDIVVLNTELSEVGGGIIFRQLKLLEHDPSVLVVSPAKDPAAIAGMYAAGCHSCIIKDDKWLNELGPAVAALSRQRRTQEAMARRAAQLTEINRILAEKNRRLDEFGMTVAHDIRGPLGGISMNIEYVLDTYADELPPRAKDLLTRAVDTSRRLTDVVQAMYAYAKLGAKAAQMAQVPLSELVRKVASDLQFSDSLDIKLGIADLPAVWGNAELLSRVFLNLITNAVKYNDKKEIVVNIGLERIYERTLARYADIFVADNGPGIPEADLKSIFLMFTRSSANSAGKEGLGVGLAVVHRIVELHFGEIRVESSVGNGSKFIISLPLEKSDLAA